MKSFIYLIILTIIIGFANTVNAQASKKAYKGYVLLESGKKITGNIEMLSPLMNQLKVKVKSLDNLNNKTFKSQEVKEYAFQIEVWNHKTSQYKKEWIRYTNKEVGRSAVPFGSKKTLLLHELKGRINYYNYYYQSNSDIDNPIKNIIYIEKTNHERGLISLNKENYKEVLKNMTYDFVELNAKIGTSQYGFKYIKKIISKYNTYMENFGEENVVTSAN